MKTAESQKTASVLFKEFLDTVGEGDAKAASALFATEGYIDAPYVKSLGFPSRVSGHEAIEQSLLQVKAVAPNFRFSSFKVILETTTEVFAEYESEAIMVTGRPYRQLYIAHVTTEDGKIVSHKEFLNTVVFVEAFFPNGLKDLITNQ